MQTIFHLISQPILDWRGKLIIIAIMVVGGLTLGFAIVGLSCFLDGRTN